jgi:cyanate permease
MLDTIKKKIDTNPGIISCLAGAFILFCSFGVRQTLGVFLIPVTSETGWDRSTFSIAAGLLQLFWGVSQPFLVYLGERKFGFGKTIFCCCLVYAVGCFILYASDISSGLFIFAMGNEMEPKQTLPGLKYISNFLY